MIKFNDLGKQWELIREICLDKIDKIGHEGSYINGSSVSEFETNFANHYNSKYSIGVSNGTDGLKLALQTFDLTENDLVIIPSNTFIADYLAVKNIPNSNPKIVLIDHDEYFTINIKDLELFLQNHRSDFNKVVIIPVHLYGHPCDMDKITELSKIFNMYIIEDCSQSHETKYKGNYLGNYGDISVYSLYPGKNLGAIGDAGIITTNNFATYERLKSLRNYGSKIKYYYDEIGHNHRLDSIQSVVLNEKLNHIVSWTDHKLNVANEYLKKIKNDKISLPKTAEYCTQHSYHVFCLIVDDRDKFENHMKNNNIPTIIHYPVPIHKTKIFSESDIVFSKFNTEKLSNNIISIPIHPFLTNNEIYYIIDKINEYK